MAKSKAASHRGQAAYRTLFGREKDLGSGSTELDQLTINHLYANIWTRKVIPMRVRSMITLALLAALGRSEELRMHIAGARRIGITRREIMEIVIHVAHYAGWPAAHNAQAIVKDAFRKRQQPV